MAATPAEGDMASTIDQLRALGGDGLVDGLRQPLRQGERPEQRLLELGVLSDRDLALEVSMRSGYPFAALRGVEPDPKLFLYLPLELAEQEIVFPLILIGDTLTVAAAFLDPELSLVTWRFPNLRIELVIAPYGELHEALARAREIL